MPQSWPGFVMVTVVVQLALIVTPVLLMTVMLTSSLRKTLLLLRWPTAGALLAASLLAVVVHPAATAFRDWWDSCTRSARRPWSSCLSWLTMMEHVPMWQILLLLAVTPAICEELAFRGFLLSGLRHLGHRAWRSSSAARFSASCTDILQQSLTAFVLGILLGYLAIQTGSLLPCIAVSRRS